MDRPDHVYIHQGPVPLLGLTALVVPSNPELTVIFVHGLNGKPDSTWCHGSIATDSHVFWPRDLLPLTVPNARILTYGYLTTHRPWFSRDDGNCVFDIGKDFLAALGADLPTVSSGKPIIFIAHSLGGIVVKEMLCRSRRSAEVTHLQNIFRFTAGIIFFGTPHAGSPEPSNLTFLFKFWYQRCWRTASDQVLRALTVTSERLKQLKEEFNPLALDQNWLLHSFQERDPEPLPSPRIPLRYWKIVPDFSSRLGLPSIEVVEQIANYHSQMCIFQDLADSEYKKVEAAVSRMVRSARSRRTGVRLTRKEKTAILSSLGLGQTDARRETIKREKVGTCEWLITHPEYHKWLNSTKDEPHSDVLWIRGKPGTGKSTMMKFALRRAKEAMPDKIVISFFFNARGDDSEKSAASMYRSLLAQLLRCLPALQTIFEAPVFDAQRHREPQDIRWTAELLKELFAAAINSMGNSSVICFVDALDECNRDEDRDTVSFLEGLCQTYARPETDFRICLSTRLFPNYATAAPVIKLEDQEGHSQDIINFLDAELRIGQGRFAEEIRSRIRSKASGVFMWVVLVVQILNQEHDAGNDAKLEQTIENTPNDLRGLFRGILIPGDTSSIELLLCLLWVLCARRPLTPAELYFAIHAYTQSTILGDWDPQKTTLEVMERFILSSSHGLTETTQSATPTVQFIHESVKDFLVEQGGLREVWPDAGTDRLAESHKILGECCRSCIATSFDTGLRGSVEAANRSQPFLGYAVHHILYHADTAQARQRSYSSEQNQATLVNNFPLHQWRHFHNLFLQDKSREHLSETSLLYILAEHDCPSLITICPGREHGFRVEVSGERYGSPIVAALVEARHETVRVLLRETLDKLPHECPLYRALRQYQWTERSGDSFPAPWPTTQETLAGYLAQYGDDTLAAFSLLLTEPDVHINDRTALCWAAEKGHLALVEFLVGRGATLDPDLMDPPLLLAARNGHEAVVRFLLDNQAQVDGSNGRKGQRPLAAAVEGNHTEIAQLLIESGADLKGAGGSCPLLTACVHGRLNMLRLILAARKQYKVDPNIETLSRQTPLHLAAGHPEIVKTLLGMGHRANVADEEGLTPLGVKTWPRVSSGARST